MHADTTLQYLFSSRRSGTTPIITTRTTSNTPYHTRTKDRIPHGVYFRLPQRTLHPHRSISSVLLTRPAESTGQLAPANNGI